MGIQAYALELTMVLILASVSNAAPFQSVGGVITARASIEGRVTLAGNAIPGVTVTLTPKTTQQTESLAISITDEAGHFKFSDL